MHSSIKRFKIKNGVTKEQLLELGFQEISGISWISHIDSNKLFKIYNFQNHLELHIEMIINDDGSISFDDSENVLAFDHEFNGPYIPFYNDGIFPFLGNFIDFYNHTMNDLVQNGILKASIMQRVLRK